MASLRLTVIAAAVALSVVPAGAQTSGQSYTEADVLFLQHMIVHHAQALEMTALAPDRTEREDVLLLARRIESSQAAEISMMSRWLEVRGEDVPEIHPTIAAQYDHADHGNNHHHDHHHDHATMPGMLSAEQLAALEAAEGETFDRLFLELMIFHHEGALVMVQELFDTDGAAQESTIFRLASHVDGDQRVEIDRMRAMLGDDA